jgi:hypothetical protein
MESRRFEEFHILYYIIFFQKKKVVFFSFESCRFSIPRIIQTFLFHHLFIHIYFFYRVCKHRKLFISQNLIGYVLHRYYFDLYSLMERDRYFVMLLIFLLILLSAVNSNQNFAFTLLLSL